MHEYWFLLGLISLAPSAVWGQNSDSILRPANATVSGTGPESPELWTGVNALYMVTGSYYNGTAKLEFEPTNQTRSDDPKKCVEFKPSKLTQEFQTMFVVFPAIDDSNSANPVNVQWTLWPFGFDFATVPDVTDPLDFTSLESVGYGNWHLEWLLQSANSSMNYDTETAHWKELFALSISQDHKDYYSVSANMGKYHATNIGTFSTTGFNGKETLVAISSEIKSQEPSPRPEFEFEFNGASTNAIWTKTGARLWSPTNTSFCEVNGNLKVTMSLKIDRWHSDILINDGERPTWNRTVGYDKGYYGYNPSHHDDDNGASSQCLPPKLITAIVVGALCLAVMFV